MKVKKVHVLYVRIVAITMSCLVATMTFLNILTIVTHGIQFEIPSEDDFTWAIDPMEKRLLFLTNFTVKNHGSYDINGIDIRASLVTPEENVLIDFKEEDLVVTQGSDKKFEVVISLSLDRLNLSQWFKLLYEDTVLSLIVDIDADYMFGLIHATVDEVLEYQWKAPLSKYLGDEELVSGVRSILTIAESGIARKLGFIEREVVEYIMGIDYFEYSTPDGYRLVVDTENVSEYVKQLSVDVEIPIKEFDGTLSIGFSAWVGMSQDAIWAELREVRIEYVAE